MKQAEQDVHFKNKIDKVSAVTQAIDFDKKEIDQIADEEKRR